MGFALDRLGPAECRRIFEALTGPVREQGSRLWSDCPYGHETSKNKTASCYKYEEDQWKCYSCGEYGDIITVYAVANGLEPGSPDAFRAFATEYVPGWEADGAIPAKRKTVPRIAQEWHGAPPDMPPPLWSSKAGEFVDSCVAVLPDSPKAKVHLSDHGIDLATAQKYGLGWNDHDRYYPVTAWGLPYQEGAKGERKIWLPKGLVLPTYFKGHVAKLKIRRDDHETGPEKLRDRKYWEGFGGSKSAYVVLGEPEKVRVWILVETERDAFTVMRAVSVFPWAESFGVMANCGTGKRPDAETERYLRGASLILNALDTDNAGRDASFKFWSREFPNSVRWPVPRRYGKDVGDAVMPLRFRRLYSSTSLDRFDWMVVDSMYLDLAVWIDAGLPNHVRRELGALVARPKPVAAQVAPVGAAQPQSHWEQVLAWMAPWPLWRRELIGFQTAVRENGFRVFRKQDGSLWLGLNDDDWPRLHANELRRVLFVDLRQSFYSLRELDAEMGKNSLENIIGHYFKEQLEVRG
ncbi:hypothetical protein LF599_04565 [Pseudodesulfovibrio thermohalotolerans]|uniref:hypothetical protein n=1 Tax=Pseudodesulfovibrio thermohalotolerans TaxID=2880651 RepID=UPI00244107FA|nr:hypothetical protein [Pseudodesulfovibrio thermohalotolerans]WFS63441.1 hypothetical protein LF599_04565 [Pseudodesulfovibrio thermohalotolerans]